MSEEMIKFLAAVTLAWTQDDPVYFRDACVDHFIGVIPEFKENQEKIIAHIKNSQCTEDEWNDWVKERLEGEGLL